MQTEIFMLTAILSSLTAYRKDLHAFQLTPYRLPQGLVKRMAYRLPQWAHLTAYRKKV